MDAPPAPTAETGLLIRRNRAAKRAADCILGFPLALLALPVVCFFALWIRLLHRGPAFFAHEREGYGGRVIRVWKLGTRHPDAEALLERYLQGSPEAREEWRRCFKLKDDPRVLPGIGRLLRRTSLDELPQLWNVLRGEMSLVGPRPLPAYHLAQFSPQFRALRSRVVPGITGLWQVSARDEDGIQALQSLDTEYIRHWSVWLDLGILLRTVRAVTRRRGAC